MGTTAAEITSELSLLSVVLRLAFATFIGALVGVERSSRGRGAGVKTHALVSMGIKFKRFRMAVQVLVQFYQNPQREHDEHERHHCALPETDAHRRQVGDRQLRDVQG